MPIFTNESN